MCVFIFYSFEGTIDANIVGSVLHILVITYMCRNVLEITNLLEIQLMFSLFRTYLVNDFLLCLNVGLMSGCQQH